MRTTRLRVVMADVTPEVCRTLDVPAACTLPELHLLLQAALGWTDSHLHQFVVGDRRWGSPHQEWDDGQLDESRAGLRELGPRFDYLYDFGDGWEHTVEVLGSGGDEPGCVDGRGVCPPEDCGGPPGYEQLLEVLADPTHPEHEHLTAWAGPRPDVDLGETDALLRRAVGAVPDSVRLLLELLDGGVKLTAAGRLPRVVVRRVQELRPQWAWSPRLVSSEDDLVPLTALHALLREVGLARLAKGVLRPTKAAADDLEVVRRLRAAFPEGTFTQHVAQVLIYVLVRQGALPQPQLAEQVLALLGPGWRADGWPLTQGHVSAQLGQLWGQLTALDLIEGESVWKAGPAARTLLAGTAWLPAPSA